jgi:hypothetical protein
MEPIISRETIVDRRQPTIRWSAILAGTAVALGTWGVFQLLGLGAGLAAIDPDDVRSVKHATLGMGAFSVLAPLVAAFVGGLFASRLASTYDRKVAVEHGILTWGLTAALGLVATMFIAKTAAVGAAHATSPQRLGTADAALYRDADDALVPINKRLEADGKEPIQASALIAAARAANTDEGFDSDRFIDKLDDRTALDRAGATEVANQLGPRASSFVQRAPLATNAEHDRLAAAKSAGQGLLALGLAILLSLGTAIIGALLAVRGRENRPHVTAPYPIPPVET